MLCIRYADCLRLVDPRWKWIKIHPEEGLEFGERWARKGGRTRACHLRDPYPVCPFGYEGGERCYPRSWSYAQWTAYAASTSTEGLCCLNQLLWSEALAY